MPFVLIAVFADVIAPYDPTEPIPGAKIFEPPFWIGGRQPRALLGTDFQGRDVLSRLIFGARVSLIVGRDGNARGRRHRHRAGDPGRLRRRLGRSAHHARHRRLAGLPAIMLAIFLATMVGPSMWNIIVILGLVYWTRYARVIRGEVLTLRERELVKLAEIAGASHNAA